MIYEVTVESGEDIKSVISDYVLRNRWENVYICGAVGSVRDMAYTTPIRDTLPLVTATDAVEGAAEVISFTGEVMMRERMDPALKAIYTDKESPLFVHIHIGCAHRGQKMKGGGLARGKAFRSLRVFMVPLE